MLFNFHTHTTFSDGKNTPSEVVEYAIKQGFGAVGFSDHAFTSHDTRYCMVDLDGYLAEINRLKVQYKDKIQIYLGTEEDATEPVKRENFDYVIGSLHYIVFEDKCYPLDSNYEYFSACANLFKGDTLAFAKCYYEKFCAYIERRKPDVIGHFDVITKFEELHSSRFLGDTRYWAIAENAVQRVLETGCIFEVNTGMITRGGRSMPYPHERLLKIIAKNGGRVTLSSDAHQMEHLCSNFDKAQTILKNIGFDGVYALYDGKWQKMKMEKE